MNLPYEKFFGSFYLSALGAGRTRILPKRSSGLGTSQLRITPVPRPSGTAFKKGLREKSLNPQFN